MQKYINNFRPNTKISNNVLLRKLRPDFWRFQKFHFDNRFRDIYILKKEYDRLENIEIAKELAEKTSDLKEKVTLKLHNKSVFKYFFSQLYANWIRFHVNIGFVNYRSPSYRYYNLKDTDLKKKRRRIRNRHFNKIVKNFNLNSLENFKEVYGIGKPASFPISELKFKQFVRRFSKSYRNATKSKNLKLANSSNKSRKLKLKKKKLEDTTHSKFTSKTINLAPTKIAKQTKDSNKKKSDELSTKKLSRLLKKKSLNKMKKKQLLLKKFVYKKNKISIFRFFYVFFKQQFWVATLFSAFNKSGKKKLAINYYLNIIIFLKKKYKKSSTFFVDLYFNQVMMNVMPYICYKRIVKRRKFYRYPYLAGKDFSNKRFRQCKALSIRWIKKSVYSRSRTELSIFLKLWSVLQETRGNSGFACLLRTRFYIIFCKRKSYRRLHWLGRWI